MQDDTEEFEGGSGGKSSISADLIRGHINTIILRSLYDRDKYGYEIINEINEKSHGQYTLKQPTLYSALKRLENQGYIQAYWKTDEVSAGGRRKYFRLTESGKEITEQNQAEWEYSRTVIDNLISDRNFDFSQPAPTPVDFKILRQATSRVPVVHDEGDEHGEENGERNTESEVQPAETPVPEFLTYTVADENETVYIDDPENPVETEENTKQETESVSYEAKTERAAVYSEMIFTDGALLQESSEESEEPNQPEQTSEEETATADDEQAASAAETQQEEPAQSAEPSEDAYTLRQEQSRYSQQLTRTVEDDESRRIAHENYLKLISGDERREESAEVTPYAENMDTTKLVYNLRSEQERDYKNLIDRLFDNTLKNTEPPPPVESEPIQPVQEPVRQARVSTGYFDATDKAAADGLKVSTSDEAFAAGAAKQTTYNKGATLFKCSLIIGVIMLLEFTLTLLFRDELHVSVAYPVVILILGLALVLVCGILFGAKYGNHVRKPTSLRYISAVGIITAILICIIFIFAVILQVNWSVTADVLAKIVIPCIIALNIPIFTLAFYLFTK